MAVFGPWVVVKAIVHVSEWSQVLTALLGAGWLSAVLSGVWAAYAADPQHLGKGGIRESSALAAPLIFLVSLFLVLAVLATWVSYDAYAAYVGPPHKTFLRSLDSLLSDFNSTPTLLLAMIGQTDIFDVFWDFWFFRLKRARGKMVQDWDGAGAAGIRVPLLCSLSMPGIDFAEVRSRVRLAQVLELAGFRVVSRMGDQVRGPCPVHGSSSPRSRSFSANLGRNTFRCFRCGATGNQLDLWVAISKLPLHEAATDLCARLGIEIPFIRRD
jgi:hypothetical protein